MATPGGKRPLYTYELEDLHGHRLDELNEMASKVMNRLGVPRELRGIIEEGPQAKNITGRPFTFEGDLHPQGGRNTRSGRNPQLEKGGQLRVKKGGISVDAAVLDDDFLPFDSWKKATIEERMEAIIAHELVEYKSPGLNYSTRHADAIMRSYRNPNISAKAKAIIEDQYLNAIAGGDKQIITELRPRIQEILREAFERSTTLGEPK
jgi:hypothetical protein